MIKGLFVFLFSLCVITAIHLPRAEAQDSERTAKNSIYIEGFGPGLFYSLNYERMLPLDFTARMGFSYVKRSYDDVDAGKFVFLPITVSYLGIGRGFSVREVIDSALRVTGKEIPVVMGARRPGDPPTLYADASKIRQTLSWQPKFTELDDILRTAWEWFREHPDGYGD